MPPMHNVYPMLNVHLSGTHVVLVSLSNHGSTYPTEILLLRTIGDG